MSVWVAERSGANECCCCNNNDIGLTAVMGDGIGNDTTASTEPFSDIITTIIMVIGALVGQVVVVWVESRCFRCGGITVALREK